MNNKKQSKEKGKITKKARKEKKGHVSGFKKAHNKTDLNSNTSAITLNINR